ncbi:DUF1700 domain-containing protein [Gorillibacterium massiliense]|uniref:DUF1700 domain-containing protein n=1 Tax=Gorillibacterium massiliense TaxID=1280390 RepID=UPI0004ACD5E4|nr:DUF1700 domain-containing protein [Gorillibacterium massiliense]
MGAYGNEYLRKFYEFLKYMPEEERQDAVREIESNIAEGIANGQSEAAILARLGNPYLLARAYQSEYMMERQPSHSLKDVLLKLRFYCTTGLISIMVVPVLATIMYSFGFCAVLTLIAGVIRSFGVPWINMSLGPNYEVPYSWSIPFAVVTSAFIGGIALISRKYLNKYLKFVSVQYSKLKPGSFA